MANSNIVDFRAPARIIPVVRPATHDSPPIPKHFRVVGNVPGPWLEATGERIVDGRRETKFDVVGIYRNQGYRLLEDYYLEEDNRAGWADYQRYLEDWQANRTKESFPRHLLPRALQDGKAAMRKVDPWSPENIGGGESYLHAEDAERDEVELLRMELADAKAKLADVGEKKVA